MNAATIANVTFRYPKTARVILRDVSFDCPQGKITAIMGGSGSGKTTLLRLMGGLFKQEAGEVTVFNQAVKNLSGQDLLDLRQRLGFLFQFGALFTDLSVFDNVAFPLREHTDLPESAIADLVLLKLHAVGLRGAANLMPSQISGGMARRVALARAIALDPELILYDEPFAGLDPVSLGVTARLIANFGKALSATTVIVSHDVAETFAIADHIVLLSQGQVLAQGSPADIRASSNAEVQQFITGAADGPIKFHMPAADYATQLGLKRDSV